MSDAVAIRASSRNGERLPAQSGHRIPLPSGRASENTSSFPQISQRFRSEWPMADASFQVLQAQQGVSGMASDVFRSRKARFHRGALSSAPLPLRLSGWRRDFRSRDRACCLPPRHWFNSSVPSGIRQRTQSRLTASSHTDSSGGRST